MKYLTVQSKLFLAICAERTACVKAVSKVTYNILITLKVPVLNVQKRYIIWGRYYGLIFQGIKDFSAIAIGADLEHDFCGPCGACRQFLCEFNPEIPIYLIRSKDHIVQLTSLATLLPESFTPKRHKFEFFNEWYQLIVL